MAAFAATANAMSGCYSAQLFLKASLSAAGPFPFVRRVGGISTLIKITPKNPLTHPLAAIKYHLNNNNNNIYILSSDSISASGTRRRRRRRKLLQLQSLRCYSTEAEVNAQISSTSSDGASSSLDEVDVTDANKDKTILLREAGNSLDIRVGRIVKVWRHEEADSLYVEEVDIGEPEPRTICSGLVPFIPIHLLQDKNVIVLANLKPRNMRGVKSSGMLMAASDASHENVELLVPPEGSVPGERVWFGSGSIDEKENLPEVASPNQVQKKKIWESVQPHLRTDETCAAALGGIHYMRTSAGLITSQSLKDATIS